MSCNCAGRPREHRTGDPSPRQQTFVSIFASPESGGSMADFETEANIAQQTGIVAEFWHFLSHSKKWWLLPIVVILLVFGVLVFLSSTAAAPFIYTLF